MENKGLVESVNKLKLTGTDLIIKDLEYGIVEINSVNEKAKTLVIPKGTRVIEPSEELLGKLRNIVGITTIKLPDNLEIIGGYTFARFKDLKEIHIPKRVEQIQEYAFNSCSNLTHLELGDSVKEIGESAFYL